MSSTYFKKKGKSRKVAHSASTYYHGNHEDDHVLPATSLRFNRVRRAGLPRPRALPNHPGASPASRTKTQGRAGQGVEAPRAELARYLHFFPAERKSRVVGRLPASVLATKRGNVVVFSAKETKSVVGLHGM